MKKIILILIFFVSCTQDEEMKPFIFAINNVSETLPKVKLIALDGQSNALGQGLNSSASAGELAEQTHCSIFQNSDAFELLNIGSGNNISNTDQHGLELGLSQQITEDFYIVKYGINSSLIDVFLPGGIGYYNFNNLFLTPAVSELVANNVDYELIKVLWIGEENAKTLSDANDFRAKLDTYYNAYTSTYGSSVKFRLIQIMDAARPYADIVNDAMDDFATTKTNVVVIQSKNVSTNLHPSYSELKVISQMIVDSL